MAWLLMSSLDMQSPRPLYRQLASNIRDSIRAGEFKTGAKLPSTSILSKTFQVAPMTVRQAIDLLRADGLVMTMQGRGTFVLADTDTQASLRDKIAIILHEYAGVPPTNENPPQPSRDARDHADTILALIADSDRN